MLIRGYWPPCTDWLKTAPFKTIHLFHMAIIYVVPPCAYYAMPALGFSFYTLFFKYWQKIHLCIGWKSIGLFAYVCVFQLLCGAALMILYKKVANDVCIRLWHMSTDDDNLLVLKTLNGTQECNIVSPKHILCISKKFINRIFLIILE